MNGRASIGFHFEGQYVEVEMTDGVITEARVDQVQIEPSEEMRLALVEELHSLAEDVLHNNR